MSDVNSNININIDASEALATIKNLQRQISLFHQEMARSGSAANQAAARGLQDTLMKNINATGQFRSQIKTIQSETEHFTEQLERNKMSIGQYFRYAGASTKSFGKLWKSEFNTIEKVAVERVKSLQTQYIKLGRDANGALKSIAIRPLALDMNNFATKAAVAAQKQALLNQLLKQGSTAMLNWGKNTQWAGRQLMVGFTIPLAMAGTAAAKAYIDFEKAAIKFKRVYGDFNTASADVDKMASSIKGLAEQYTKYGVAVSDTMNMAADAAAQGKTGADLLAQVTQSARLAVLGNVDQAQSLETLTSLTNTFGIAAENLATNIDFLNAVENQTVTSIEDLTEAIPKAAPVVKQLGGDVKDLTYFLTAMKEGGINASEGANAIKSGLASIINPTKAATDMLNGYGISITAIRDAHPQDVSGMVQDLAVQLDKLAPMDRARAIETLFGKFQFSRMSTMFQNIAKDGSQANKVLETAKMSQEELAVLSERELKKIESSPAFKFDKALKDIQAKLIPVGEAFLKAVTPIVEWVGKILDGFNGMGDGAKQFATMATLAIAGLGPVVLMTVGLIANGVANLIKLFAGIKSFFNGTRGGAKDLGDATEYMTQKELEAQAVASSLEQGHAKLTQQFTLQTEAIQNLVSEYERAINAQGRMLAGMGTVASNTPGFSTGGTVVGPGGPTSDNLVARVSAGEEVFSNADIAPGGVMHDALARLAAAGIDVNEPGARRRASISGNIANAKKAGVSDEQISDVVAKVQEFGATTDQARTLISHLVTAAKGGPEVLTNWLKSLQENAQRVSGASELIDAQKASTGVATNKNAKQFTHATSGVEMSIEEASRLGLFEGSGNIKEAERELAKAQSGQKAQKFKLQTMFGMSNFDATTNGRLANVGVENQEFMDKYDEAGIEKWNDSIVAGGGNLEQLNQEIVKFDANIKKFIAESGQSRVFDNPEIAARAGGGVALTDAVAYARSQASPEMVSAIDTAATTTRETRVGGGLQTVSGKFDQTAARPVLAEQWSKDMGVPLEEIKTKTTEGMKKVGESGADGFIEGGKDGLDSHSPSRKMHQVGKDGADGLINGAKEGFAKIPGVPVPGSPASAPTSSKSIPGVPTPPAVTPEAQSGFMGKMKTVASDLGSKGLNLVAQGIEKGKDKVITVAGTALNNYLEAGYRQADAENELRTQRFRVANAILEATDSQVAAMREEISAIREKGNYTEEEKNIIRNNLDAIQKKKEALVQEIENSGQDLQVIEQRLQNAKKADGVNDLEAANAQQDGMIVAQDGQTAQQDIINGNANERANQKQEKKNARKRRSGKFVGAAMGVSMGLMAASQLPGQAGQAAGAVAGPLSAGLGVASMLPGPWGLALGAIVALGTAAFQVNEAMNKARDEAYKLARAMGTGKDAIQKFADFTGKATATEIMDKKRDAKRGMFEIQPGKRSFGQSYFESESGKALKTTASQGIAKFGKDSSATMMANQLSTAVASGALNAKQARSIAGQLGQELGDTSFGISIVAQMNQLIGPDGENLTNGEALKVRTKMIDIGQKELQTQQGNVDMNVGSAMAQSFKDWDFMTNITGGEGSIGNAISQLSGLGAISDITAGIAAGVTYFTQMGTEMGALQAGYQNQMEMEQQLIDSMDLQYQQKIDTLKAQGKINEALELQKTYEQERAELVNQQGETTTANMDAYDKAGEGAGWWFGSGQANLGNSVNDSIKNRFKDQGMDAQVQQVIDTLTNADIDNRTEYGIKSAVASGQMGLNQAKMASTMFANNDANTALQGKDLENMMGKGGMGVEATNQALSLASLLKTPESQAEFMVQFKGMSNEEAQPILDAMEEVKKSGKVFDADAIVQFYAKNPALLKDVKEDMDKLKDASKNKTKITTEMVSKIVDPEAAEIIKNDVEYFNGLDKDQQIVYTQTVDTMMNMYLNKDPVFQRNYETWLAQGNSGTEQDYINYLARQETVLGTDIAETKAPKTTDGGGTGGGPEAHWTDDYVKKLRDFSMASQKLTTGINASTSALKNFKKAGQASFNGLSNQLRAAGASEAMIGHILDDDAKNIAKFFKNGKLTAEGLKVQARMYQATIAEYVDQQKSAAEVSRDQATAMRKLTAAGMSYVAASDAIQNAELAQAIAHATNAAEVRELIAAYKQAQVEAYKVNEATAEGRAKNTMELAESHISALEAVSNKYQTGLDLIASQEDDINKTYEKRMEALDKVLAINQDIAASQQDQLTMAEALSKGDIFAAAKAMADQKARDAQKNAEAQKQALTDARDAQVAGLTATIGGKQMTREQLEEKIKNINDQILKIKRDEIDAQNELIARKEYEAKLDIAKQARNNAPKKEKSPGGGNPQGGSGSGSGSGKGNGDKDKSGTTNKSSSVLSASDNTKVQTLNKTNKDLKKKLADTDAAIAKAVKAVADAKKTGNQFIVTANQNKLSALYEDKRHINAAISSNAQTARSLVGKTRNSNGWMARFSDKDIAGIIGINFLDKGKSPKRMGLMKHPFARGNDLMPTMVGLKEFTVQAGAVKKYGMDKMLKLNSGMLDLDNKKASQAQGSNKIFKPVYNINVDIAKTDAQPQEIALAVMRQIEAKDQAIIKGLGA